MEMVSFSKPSSRKNLRSSALKTLEIIQIDPGMLVRIFSVWAVEARKHPDRTKKTVHAMIMKPPILLMLAKSMAPNSILF